MSEQNKLIKLLQMSEQNKLIKLLQELLGKNSEEVANFKAFFEKGADKKFRIANAGPMNPGKSTLFNAFLQKEEVFKTADARQTAVAQEEAWKDDILLVDTPGCNSAVIEDNAESVAAFRKADFITFVHNINSGGLTDAELKILEHIRTIFGEKDFQSRVCIVCNRIDDVEDDETLQRNKNEILCQVKDNLGTELKLYCVSPLNYLKGLASAAKGEKEEAQIYLEYSGMQILLDAVTAAAASGKRGAAQFEKLTERLKDIQGTYQAERKKLRTKMTKIRKDADNKWENVLDNIHQAWNECL